MKINKLEDIPSNIIKLFQIFLIIILLFPAFFSISKSKSEVDTVKNAFSENHDLISHIAEKSGLSIPLSTEEKKSINEFMQIVAYFESKLVNDTKNSYYRGQKNTAKGYFQFLDSSFNWVLGIIHKKIDPEFPDGSYVYEYSYSGQAQFAITLWYQFASNSEIEGLFERDYNSAIKIYCTYHHTDCGSQLTAVRYTELKSALRSWSNDSYHKNKELSSDINKKQLEKIITPKQSISSSDISLEDITFEISSLTKKTESLQNLTTEEKEEYIASVKRIIQKIELRLEILFNQIQDKKEDIDHESTSIEEEPPVSDTTSNSLEDHQKTETEQHVCTTNLIDFTISQNGNNKKYDVIDLENFLNKYENENLDLNGIFESEDIDAVKRFQEKYREDILTPLDIKNPTGDVYEMTQDKINDLYCDYKKSGNPLPAY